MNNISNLKSIQSRCRKDKHILRTNKFGITWCIGCGLLSNKIVKSLQESEGFIISYKFNYENI